MLKFCHPFLLSVILLVGFFSCSDPVSPDTTPPSSPVLNPVVYSDNSFIVSWSTNTDSDFENYSLYHSNSPTISDSIMIFETSNKQETSYTKLNVTIAKKHYFKILSSDDAGLTASSNIEEGISHLFICNFEYYYSEATGFLFISDTTGQMIGESHSWTNGEQVVVENPNLNPAPDEIGLTFFDYSLPLETFLNIPTGSEWYINNSIDILNDTPSNITLHFDNIPEHQGYLLSTEFIYNFEYSTPIISPLEIITFLSPGFYLKLAIQNTTDKFIWIPSIGGNTYNVDLNDLQNTQSHIIQNIPSNIPLLSSKQKGFLNPGVYDEAGYVVNIGTIADLEDTGLTLEIPDSHFSDYYSFTYFYENFDFNVLSYHEVYGELPTEFHSVDGNVEIINSNEQVANIQTLGEFDAVYSEWSIGDGSWFVLSPPGVENIILPYLATELNNISSGIFNFEEGELVGVTLEEFPEIASYSDYIRKDFEENVYFWNVISEKRYREFKNIQVPTQMPTLPEMESRQSLRYH